MTNKLEILIKACINNDRASQKSFYLLTADKLMNVSRRYSSDLDEAKDILQNAYIQIFKHLPEFDMKKGNIESWLVKIVVNEALQVLRKKKSINIQEQIAGEKFEILRSPDVLARLHAEDVLNIVRRLPEGYRIIFNMAVIEGYSHKEIAAELDIAESTSRSQLTRAKKLIRELLREQKISELC